MKHKVGDLVSVLMDNVERIALIIGTREVQHTGCIIFDYQILFPGIIDPVWVFEDEIVRKYEI